MNVSPTSTAQPQLASEFFNWTVMLSMALFGINNWWLKYAFPNWLTGKLSDFLFCFFFPLYCSAILAYVTDWPIRRRVWLGAGLTFVAFVAMKSSPAISDWVSDVLSIFSRTIFGGDSINRVDPTDLIVAPAVLCSVLFALRRENPA
jgi:hypothetical protein